MFTKWFYGNEISDYGKENGRVDYRTFAKAFNHVLNNNIMEQTANIGYWEQISGTVYRDADGNEYTAEEAEEKREELEQRKADLEDMIADINNNIADEEDGEADEGKLAELNRDLKGTEDELATVEENLEALEDIHYPDVFQWYIVDDNGAQICEEFGEVLYYNEELDIYLWGVTHYGTSWDYVLTNIKCNPNE